MTTIPLSALDFLRELRENNNRNWFNERKTGFKILKDQLELFFSEVADLLEQHDDLEKWRMYRIYRDVHFSKDKTPYKRYFAAEFNRRKPALRGGYYIRIAPDNQSFIEAGFWGPNARDLRRMRKEWELDGEEIRAILSEKEFKSKWGEMIGEKLKTAPSGFDREHANIDLINYKQWVFHHPFTDREVLSGDFAAMVNAYYTGIRPFFDYMSAVLTSDLNGESLLG